MVEYEVRIINAGRSRRVVVLLVVLFIVFSLELRHELRNVDIMVQNVRFAMNPSCLAGFNSESLRVILSISSFRFQN